MTVVYIIIGLFIILYVAKIKVLNGVFTNQKMKEADLALEKKQMSQQVAIEQELANIEAAKKQLGKGSNEKPEDFWNK